MAAPGKVRSFLEMIRFSHTLFALPFALTGGLVAKRNFGGAPTLLWILGAMVGARTAAMSFNRLVDHHLDGQNPRTAGRALPAGLLSRGFVAVALVASVGLFLLSAASLNELCFMLAWPTLVVLLGYSMTKRFTSLCHFALGLALGISPIGAYLGVMGSFDKDISGSVESEVWAVMVLAGAVILWVAGFDIIYACQDVEADRALGLHSIPARWGIAPALRMAVVLHVVTVGLLFAFGVMANLKWPYFVAMGPVIALIFMEHRVVKPDDLARVNLAFFQINAAVSILVLAGTAAALYL